ncbi:MAG: DUF1491 family protein [Pseudomonadota bacterium]
MRVTSSLWVAAHIRSCFSAGAFALVEHKGADEAGAIFIRIDMPNNQAKFFLPAPQAAYERGSDQRMWEAYKDGAVVDMAEINQLVERERRIDPDSWVVVVEDREGRSFLGPDLLV